MFLLCGAAYGPDDEAWFFALRNNFLFDGMKQSAGSAFGAEMIHDSRTSRIFGELPPKARGELTCAGG